MSVPIIGQTTGQPAQAHPCATYDNNLSYEPGTIVVHRKATGDFGDLLMVRQQLIGQSEVIFVCPYLFRPGIENPSAWSKTFANKDLFPAEHFGFVLMSPTLKARIVGDRISQEQAKLGATGVKATSATSTAPAAHTGEAIHSEEIANEAIASEEKEVSRSEDETDRKPDLITDEQSNDGESDETHDTQ